MDPEKFAESLHKNLAQRKFELSRLRFMTDAERTNIDRLNCINRSAVVLSYAHWEGFIKEASIKYVKYINGCTLKVSSLRLPLQAASMASHFKRAGASDKVRYLAEVLDEMDSRRQEHFFVDPNKIVKTDSNLSSVIFRDLVMGLGLDYLDIYETRKAFIDAKILDARNQVAHGELVSFAPDEVIDRIDGVVTLLDLYSNQLIDAVSNRSFLLVVSPNV